VQNLILLRRVNKWIDIFWTTNVVKLNLDQWFTVKKLIWSSLGEIWGFFLFQQDHKCWMNLVLFYRMISRVKTKILSWSGAKAWGMVWYFGRVAIFLPTVPDFTAANFGAKLVSLLPVYEKYGIFISGFIHWPHFDPLNLVQSINPFCDIWSIQIQFNPLNSFWSIQIQFNPLNSLRSFDAFKSRFINCKAC
jgi:hypothetical protein